MPVQMLVAGVAHNNFPKTSEWIALIEVCDEAQSKYHVFPLEVRGKFAVALVEDLFLPDLYHQVISFPQQLFVLQVLY